MFRVTFLVVAVAFSSSLALNEECKKIGAPHMSKCCKSFGMEKDLHDFRPEDMKECFANRKPPPSCDGDICLARKFGITATDDGEFDKKEIEDLVNNKLEKKPELAETILKHCVNGDLSGYGPTDFCDLAKFNHCLRVTFLMNCQEFDTSEPGCAGMKELVEKCRQD